MLEEYHFEVVRPIETHAMLVMGWRNDPVTLQMSFHSEPKHWDAFFEEFKRDYFCYPDLPPLFIWLGSRRVAFIRFRRCLSPADPMRKCCEISIIVEPSQRGKGVGTACLKEVKEWLKQQKYEHIYAEVKPENIASQKMFERAGFERYSDCLRTHEDTGEEVILLRYILRASQSPQRPPVFIVAEAGSNWRVGSFQRDLQMAKALIRAASDAGTDAVKFQVYRSRTVYVENAGMPHYLTKADIREDISKLFDDLSMPYEMIQDLAAYCAELKIEFMATPFSVADFKAIDPFVKRHKIASYEIGHLRLIELAAGTQKPLFLSTGAAVEEEIAWAVNTFNKLGGKDLTLLQCTACYPAPITSAHLNVLPWFKQRYRLPVGLSDHTLDPLIAPVAAVALGASVIEKHFTLHKNLPGPDHIYALTPEELKHMVAAIREAEKSLGWEVKGVDSVEDELREFACRGIQAIRPIEEGETFHEGINIDILRPGNQRKGIHPRHIAAIEGKKASYKIPLGSGIRFGDWQ
jgi:N-acetylneuraminate synthase